MVAANAESLGVPGRMFSVCSEDKPASGVFASSVIEASVYCCAGGIVVLKEEEKRSNVTPGCVCECVVKRKWVLTARSCRHEGIESTKESRHSCRYAGK